MRIDVSVTNCVFIPKRISLKTPSSISKERQQAIYGKASMETVGFSQLCVPSVIRRIFSIEYVLPGMRRVVFTVLCFIEMANDSTSLSDDKLYLTAADWW